MREIEYTPELEQYVVTLLMTGATLPDIERLAGLSAGTFHWMMLACPTFSANVTKAMDSVKPGTRLDDEQRAAIAVWKRECDEAYRDAPPEWFPPFWAELSKLLDEDAHLADISDCIGRCLGAWQKETGITFVNEQEARLLQLH